MKAVDNFFSFEVMRSKSFALIDSLGNRWLVFLTALIFSMWPIQTEQHSLMPGFARQELGLSDIKPWIKGINRLSPTPFKVFVGLDYAENLSLKSIAEHERAVQQIDQEQLLQRARAYPWRYAKSIAFPIATFQRQNICTLRVILADGFRSDPVDCQSIQDNHLVSFNFNRWIKPGIYSAILESTGEPGQEVAPYYATSLNQDAWLIPSQGKTSVCFWEYFLSLIYRHKIMAIAYLCLMIFLVWTLASRTTSLLKLITIYVTSIIFTNFATLPFSGHDETAHVTMYYEALKEHSLTTIVDSEFNLKTWKAMTESDFFRLHDVEPRYSGDCPHQIIGSCGVTRNPVDLYSQYAVILNWFSLKIVEPKQVVMVGRLFNVIMIFALIIIAASLLRRNELENFIVCMIFLGGLISQSASLTNDVPMFLLGCTALLCCPIVIKRSEYLGFISIVILTLFYWILRQVDVSSVTILPLLLGLFLLLLLKVADISPIKLPFIFSKSPISNPLVDVFVMASFVVIFISFYKVILNGTSIIEDLEVFEPRAVILQDFWKLPLSKVPDILYSYWKSYIGTYVWGHSYWPDWVYSFAFLAYLATVHRGLSDLKPCVSRAHYYLCIILFAGITSIQLISVLSIAAAPAFLSDPIARDSFAKVRLTAPLAVGLLVLPLMSTKLIPRDSSVSGLLIKVWLLIYAMASCFWLPTRFFFADIF